MQKSNSRFTVTVVIIIAIGLAIAAAGITGYQMQTVQINKQVAANNGIKQTIADLDKKISSTDSKKTELAEYRKLQGALDQNLTDIKYLPTYLEQMQKMAKDTGNDLLVITPGEIKPLDLSKGPFATNAPADAGAPAATPAPAAAPADKKQAANTTQVMKITISIRGSYTSLIKFLDALGNFQKLIYVKSIAVTPSGLDGKVMQLSTSVETFAIIIPSQNKKESDVKTTSNVRVGEAK